MLFIRTKIKHFQLVLWGSGGISAQPFTSQPKGKSVIMSNARLWSHGAERITGQLRGQ